MQVNIGHLDENGVYTGSFSTFAMCGQVRQKVRSLPPDDAEVERTALLPTLSSCPHLPLPHTCWPPFAG